MMTKKTKNNIKCIYRHFLPLSFPSSLSNITQNQNAQCDAVPIFLILTLTNQTTLNIFFRRSTCHGFGNTCKNKLIQSPIWKGAQESILRLLKRLQIRAQDSVFVESKGRGGEGDTEDGVGPLTFLLVSLLRIRITLMRIRILLDTLMRIRILHVNLMQIRILPFTLMRWRNRIHASNKSSKPWSTQIGSYYIHILACHLQMDADGDPAPAYHFDADSDPDPTFQFYPDPQHC